MGAKRWIEFASISIQPGEIFKIAVVLMLARYFSRASASDLKNPVFLVLPVIFLALPTFLILKQPSLGTVILILLLTLFVYFMHGGDCF